MLMSIILLIAFVVALLAVLGDHKPRDKIPPHSHSG